MSCHPPPIHRVTGRQNQQWSQWKKSLKQLGHNHLDKDRLVRALLQYRNTPSHWNGLSPAQKLFGKPIQDNLPAHHRAFAPQWQKASKEEDLTNDTPAERYYNQHAHTLPDITTGTNVAIQNPTTKRWDIYGVVTTVGPYRRYHIKTSNSRILVRNRRYIRRRVPVVPITSNNPPDNVIPPDPPAHPRRSTRQSRWPIRYVEEFVSWLPIRRHQGGGVGTLFEHYC